MQLYLKDRMNSVRYGGLTPFTGFADYFHSSH